MWVENLDIEKSPAESRTPKSVCFDVKASIVFSGSGFVVKAFALQRLKVGLDFDIVANFIHEIREGVPNFVMSLMCESTFRAVEGVGKVEFRSTRTPLWCVWRLPSIAKVDSVSEFRFREIEIVLLERKYIKPVGCSFL